jgi:hypothetical protein
VVATTAPPGSETQAMKNSDVLASSTPGGQSPAQLALQHRGGLTAPSTPGTTSSGSVSSHHGSHHHSGSASLSTGSSDRGLVQIPSNATDFPNNDPTVIKVQVTSAKKDIIGDYHIVGEITNTGNDTLSFVQVTVHLYDAGNQLIGDSTCCYTTPTNIDAGHTSTFDSFVTSDHINGTPVSFRLSYDWS